MGSLNRDSVLMLQLEVVEMAQTGWLVDWLVGWLVG